MTNLAIVIKVLPYKGSLQLYVFLVQQCNLFSKRISFFNYTCLWYFKAYTPRYCLLKAEYSKIV